MNLFKNITKTLVRMNPFYHNPIVVAADPNHLGEVKERAAFFNPELDQRTVLTLLVNNEHVRRAVADLDRKSYLVRASIIDGEIHVNLHSLMVKEDAKTIAQGIDQLFADAVTGTMAPFDAQWVKHGILQYTIDNSGATPSIRPLTGPLYRLCYCTSLVSQSWTIPLDPEHLSMLDPSITLH